MPVFYDAVTSVHEAGWGCEAETAALTIHFTHASA